MAQERRSRRAWWIGLVGLGGLALWAWRGRGEAERVAEVEAVDRAAPVEGGSRDRPAVAVRGLELRSAAISGMVRDPQGQAVAGARVCARAGEARLTRDERRAVCGDSGRDGYYRIDGLLAVRHRVDAMAPGFVPVAYTRGEGTARRDTLELRAGQEARGVDLTLEAGGVEIHGVVMDLSGGAIEGAQVTSGGRGSGLAMASSGADGEFSLWVRPGPVAVWSAMEGYAAAFDEGAAPGHRFELSLTPESVVVGKVVRVDDGSPVVGARVWVERGDSSSVLVGGGGGAVFTAADGSFRVDGLVPGAYKARAEGDDAAAVAAEQVVLGLGETSEPLVLRAHPAFFVEGRIVVTGGDGCDDGSVQLHDGAQGRGASGTAEPDGQLRVRGLLPGTYEVSLRCPGHLLADSYPPVVVRDASVTGLRWTVERGRAIRGVVVDAGGTPIMGLSVGASMRPDPQRPRGQNSTATQSTDAQGRFELSGLLPGAYQVTVHAFTTPRAVSAEPVDVTVPDGRDVEGLRLEMPVAGEVRGSVRDPQGHAVRDVQVQLLGDGRGNQTARAADDGSFRFPEVAAGGYRVVLSRRAERLRPPGVAADEVEDPAIVVKAGGVETIDLVVEGAAGRISGVVRDEGGGVVADAFVEASRESESAAAAPGESARQRWRGMFDRPRLTEADGRFTIDGLMPGTYAVRAQRRGGGEALVEHVKIGEEVALEIAATGRLAGTVSVAGGGAPAQFSVRVSDPRSGFARSDSFFRTAGAWGFADLPAGGYRVEVDAPEGTQKLEVPLAAGEVREGVRLELAGTVRVRGTVVDLEGAPVPGVEVRISAGRGFHFGQGEVDRRHISDAAGRFEVARAPVGVVSLVANPPPGEYAMVWSTVNLAAGAEEVTLPPVRVARQRVPLGGKTGDSGYTLRRSAPTEDPLQRRLVVAVVRPGGPAAAAGLQIGDEIVTVDGHDVVGANAYLHDALLAVPAGARVRLGLARGVAIELVTGEGP